MEEKKVCCICGKEFYGYGNNPEGAVWKDGIGSIIEPTFNKTDRCCNECNDKYVTIGRLYKMQKGK